MTTASQVSRGHMHSSTHTVLWCAVFMLVGLVATLSIATLYDLRDGRVAMGVGMFLVLSVMTVAGLLAYWRRYWFLPDDLKRLIAAHAGTDLERRGWLQGFQIKASIGPLWLLATLNRPILDVLPTWPTYEWKRKIAMGFSEFMLRGARVGLFQLGDFARFPEVDIVITGEREIIPRQTGNSTLDRAIQTAAQALADADLTLRVEVCDQWLQVEVDGGAWLGSRFAHKIERALEFSRRVLEQLTGSFTPMNPSEWTIEQEYARERSARFAVPLERRLRVTPVREQSQGDAKRDTLGSAKADRRAHRAPGGDSRGLMFGAERQTKGSAA